MILFLILAFLFIVIVLAVCYGIGAVLGIGYAARQDYKRSKKKK